MSTQKEIISITSRIVKKKKPDFLDFCDRGLQYVKLCEFEIAIFDFSKALNLIAERGAEASIDQISWIRVFRGWSYFNMGKFSLALRDVNIAVEVDPQYGDAFVTRSAIYIGKKEYFKVLEDATKAIDVSPHLPNAYNNRGLALNYLGRYKEAIKDLEKSIELNAISSHPFANLGFSYWKLKDYEEAFVYYQKAIKLSSTNAWTWYFRGLTYIDLKEFEKAVDDLKKAKDYPPLAEDVAKALKIAVAGLELKKAF